MGSTKITLDLLAVPTSVPAVRHAVVELARENGISEQAIAGLALSVTEAASNVVVHAYRNASDAGPLRVCAELVDRGIYVEVCDEGTGLTPRVDSPGLGLGMPLIAALASSVEICSDNDGSCIRMRFLDNDTAPGL